MVTSETIQPEKMMSKLASREHDTPTVEEALAKLRATIKPGKPRIRLRGPGVVHVDPLALFLSEEVEQQSKKFKQLEARQTNGA